jgi:CBS domain-containing protein
MMPHFGMLPVDDLEKLAAHITPCIFTKGERLAIQGKTRLSHIYVIKRGRISIHNEKDGKNQLVGHILSGEVFGGISLLMNGGISLRTVFVEEETEAYLVSHEIFLDLCSQYSNFSTFFAENFSSHIADTALDTIINSGLVKIFLSSIAPFTFLPEVDIDRAAEAISMVHYSKGSFLFIEGNTAITHLYVLHKGSARIYHGHNGHKKSQEILGEGDMYGGISMLLNNDLAVRTLEITEDSYFYLLPNDIFVSLCEQHPVFSDFFTDTFGKRMLDKSYAAIIARTSTSNEETPQLFNLPVHHICNREAVVGDADMTIRQVALRMKEKNSSYLMLPSSDPKASGIITQSDLTKKVIAAGYDINSLAEDVMSTPLCTINENAMVFEALMKMMQHNVKHIAVDNGANQIIGVLSNRELISAHGESPLILLNEIAKADSLSQIHKQHQRLPGIIKGLINRGAIARNINRLISTVSDTILKKVMELTLQEMEPPPTSFAFIIMGSEGRSEQTLKTDQDNAIIFDDVSEAELPAVSKYFLELGQQVCKRLNQVGYSYCQGDIMAQNPNWCQPLNVWMKYFLKWIHASEPEDLLHSSIFFDFRCGYGDRHLVDSLRDHLFGVIRQWQGFLGFMVENAMYFKPPLGIFRNFVVESKGEHRDSLNLKNAMTPIVDFARIYALRNGIHATNTLERLQQLHMKEILSQKQYEEIEKAYSFLMQMRIVRQLTATIEHNKPPDNFINPKRMTRIEQTMLKEIFKRIGSFQAQMSFEYTGTA